MSYPRTSAILPAEDVRETLERGGMRVAKRFGEETAKLDCVALADLSCLQRHGVKGPSAAQWLQSQGIPVPPGANRWVELPGGGVIARLGRSEFFLEDGARGDAVGRLKDALGEGKEGAYPVIRQDAGIALLGPRSNELLVQTCNVDFDAISSDEAVMTQMVGVSILAIRRDVGGLRCLRLWCDPTYAPYLWDTLSEIAAELGGGIVGSEGLLR